MLLKHLYIMSLEVPGPGCWLMVGRNDVEHLSSYVRGYIEGQTTFLGNSPPRDDEDFWNWLYDRGEFPTQGWARNCLEKCDGDRDKALARFFSLLHTFLLERRPEWFVEFNATPQPSPFYKGSGERRSPDIRLARHVHLICPSQVPNITPD